MEVTVAHNPLLHLHFQAMEVRRRRAAAAREAELLEQKQLAVAAAMVGWRCCAGCVRDVRMRLWTGARAHPRLGAECNQADCRLPGTVWS